MKTLLIVSTLAALSFVTLPQQAEASGYRGHGHRHYHHNHGHHGSHQRCEWRRHWHHGGWQWYRHCG